MPRREYGLKPGLVRQHFAVVLGAHQNVQLADLVQQARQKRFVRIELGAHSRQHVSQRGGMNAVPPNSGDMVAKLPAAVTDEHLLRGER